MKAITYQLAHNEKLCAALPLPSRGGARGGVCNFHSDRIILTPPPPLPYMGGEGLRNPCANSYIIVKMKGKGNNRDD